MIHFPRAEYSAGARAGKWHRPAIAVRHRARHRSAWQAPHKEYGDLTATRSVSKHAGRRIDIGPLATGRGASTSERTGWACLQPVGPGSGGDHRLNDAVTSDAGMPWGAQHWRLTCHPAESGVLMRLAGALERTDQPRLLRCGASVLVKRGGRRSSRSGPGWVKLEGLMSTRAQEIRAGLAWLHAADPVLAEVIDERPDFDPGVWIRRLPAMGLFGALVFQIIGQQISVIAATAIFARLTERFGGRVPDAGELAAVDQGTLHTLGLSRRKAATVLDLAQRFSDGRLSEAELRELPDQEVIRQLTDVKGIGAWTVQGALLIALQRPDVIRPDDLALRHAIQARYGLDHLPDPAEVADLAQRWRPYRSLASSLLLAAAKPA